MNVHRNATHWLTIVLLAAGLLFPAPPGGPAAPGLIFQVTKTADTNDGSCDADCSLREAVIASNAASGADTILVPPASYALTIAGQNEDAAATGDLDFSGPVVVNATGAAISADNIDRVLHILAGGAVTVTGAFILYGDLHYTTGNGGNVLVASGARLVLDSVMVAAADQNDGIYNAGILTLTNSSVIGNLYRGLDNVAPGRATLVSSSVYANAGGGIFNSGELMLIATRVDANNLPGSGGPILEGSGAGIANLGAATLLGSAVRNNAVTSPNFGQAVYGGGLYSLGPLTITNSSISGNIAGRAYPVENDGYGAGIYNRGALTIGGSTIAFNTTGNRGGNGGGLSLDAGSAYIVNSTISDNTAGADCTGSGCSPTLSGGGIHNAGLLSLNNVTIAGNQTSQGGAAGLGGGIYAAGGVWFRNTLLGLNRAGSGPDCYGGLVSLDYNLIQNVSQCTLSGVTTHNITGVDPVLGPLQNNGGPTYTRALLAGSPAIDAADNVSCQPVDQRGAPRPAGAACDIGAYERDATPPTATPLPTLTSTPIPATSTPTGQASTDTPTPGGPTNTPTPGGPTNTPAPATPTPTGLPPGAYLPLVLYNAPP